MKKANLIKRILTTMLATFLLLTVSVPYISVYAKQGKGTADIVAQYNNPNGRLLCVAHKAYSKGLPENSLEGILDCIKMGVDIIELDIRRTMDGYLIVFEDESLSRMLVDKNGEVVQGQVSEKRLDEIQEYRLKSNFGGIAEPVTDFVVPTLELALKSSKGRVMLILDNAWQYRDEVYDILRENGMLDSVIIKAKAPSKEVGEWINSKPQIPLTCGYYDGNMGFNIKRYIKSSAKNGTRVVQLASNNRHASMFADSVNKSFKNAKGYVNMAEPELCGHRQDNLIPWGEALEKGYSIIETSEPQLLLEYIQRTEKAIERLAPVIATAQAVNTSLYTQDSVKALKEALENANGITADGTVSEGQIMSAYTELNSAIRNLIDKNMENEKGVSFKITSVILAVIIIIIVVYVQVYMHKKSKNRAETKESKHK